MKNCNFYFFMLLFFTFIYSCRAQNKNTSVDIQEKQAHDLLDGLFDDQGEENITIIDSLKIDKNRTAYCFTNEGIISGSESYFISITENICKVSRKNSIAMGSKIYGFSQIVDKTIYLYAIERPTITDTFTLFNFSVINLGNQEDFKKYKQKNVKRVYKKDFCK